MEKTICFNSHPITDSLNKASILASERMYIKNMQCNISKGILLNQTFEAKSKNQSQKVTEKSNGIVSNDFELQKQQQGFQGKKEKQKNLVVWSARRDREKKKGKHETSTNCLDTTFI